MKQTLAVLMLILCINSFAQDDIDTTKRNRNDKSIYFKQKTNINYELVNTLLKDFDSTEILNSGEIEYRLKRVGTTFNSTSFYVALIKKKDNRYILRAHFRYYEKLANYILKYSLHADGLAYSYEVKDPKRIQTNGTNKSVHQHNLDEMLYKIVSKMANAKEAKVVYTGVTQSVPYELDNWDKKNLRKTLELLALLTE